MFQKYKEISNKTYHTFDVYHVHAISMIIDNLLNVRDMTILVFIDTHEQGVTPKLLTDVFKLQPNALSNRLKHLESSGFITRTQNDVDKRQVDIMLTYKGKQELQKYQNYLNALLIKLKKNISILSLNQIIKTIQKVIKYSKESEAFDNKNKATLESTLFSLQMQFSNYDNAILERYDHIIKHRELFVLSEYYIQLHHGNKSYTELSNHLAIPYQTIVSIMHKFERLNIIDLKQAMVFRDTNMVAMVEDFITSRVLVYYQFMEMFTTKEEEIIMMFFQTLKQHALSYIK
jgi:DNA-binding MarR family transcriptional regulator